MNAIEILRKRRDESGYDEVGGWVTSFFSKPLTIASLAAFIGGALLSIGYDMKRAGGFLSIAGLAGLAISAIGQLGGGGGGGGVPTLPDLRLTLRASGLYVTGTKEPLSIEEAINAAKQSEHKRAYLTIADATVAQVDQLKHRLKEAGIEVLEF